MGRPLAVAVAALAVLLVFLLPEVSSSRMAALESYRLLELPVGDPPPSGQEDQRPSLGALVLAGKAARDGPGGERVLALHGARVGADAEAEPDLAHSLDLRRSMVRGLRQLADGDGVELVVEGEQSPVEGGAGFFLHIDGDQLLLAYEVDDADEEPVVVRQRWSPPGPTSLLPPMVAIALAVLLRKPLLALSVGVLVGAFLHRTQSTGTLGSLALAPVDFFARYFWFEFSTPGRAMIIGFVVFMLAMVGVMTRSGGIRGLMDTVARLASDVRRSQIATFLMGLAVFFDDYANTILVGSTMRPLTDRFKVAREKLAYIVDSTAAPVAGISIFSTWIAFEVSTFSAQLPAAGLSPDDGYAVFVRTIPYSFYCILALVLVGLVAFSGRDFGPMLTAERRARKTGALLRPGATPMVSEEATTLDAAEGVTPRAWRAVLPLLAFVGVTLLEILRAGGAFDMPASELFTLEGAAGVLYDGSGERPLLIGSLAGFLVAALGAASAGLAGDVVRASWTTLRSMGVAFGILYLAWMIGRVCKDDLGTAPYLTALVGDALDPLLLPSMLFLLAGLVAFATGSSWSTMSILLPLVVGLSFHLGTGTELAGSAQESGELLLVMSIAAVLSGSIFGDHCSPISDTTVMSSIASASDHIDHVRTQAPYALVAMAVALLCGHLPSTYLGAPPLVCLGAGTVALVLIVFLMGRRAEAD